MTCGRHLEQRKFGVYYFRQTRKINGTQRVKRFSLRTKDLGIAKFLALQFLANIKMHEINIDGLKKFEVEYDDSGGIKRLKVDGEADRKNFHHAMTLVEYQKAQQHQRDLEKLKFGEERAMREKQSFSESDEGKELLSSKQKLEREMVEKPALQGKTLETLRTSTLRMSRSRRPLLISMRTSWESCWLMRLLKTSLMLRVWIGSLCGNSYCSCEKMARKMQLSKISLTRCRPSITTCL